MLFHHEMFFAQSSHPSTKRAFITIPIAEAIAANMVHRAERFAATAASSDMRAVSAESFAARSAASAMRSSCSVSGERPMYDMPSPLSFRGILA